MKIDKIHDWSLCICWKLHETCTNKTSTFHWYVWSVRDNFTHHQLSAHKLFGYITFACITLHTVISNIMWMYTVYAVAVYIHDFSYLAIEGSQLTAKTKRRRERDRKSSPPPAGVITTTTIFPKISFFKMQSITFGLNPCIYRLQFEHCKISNNLAHSKILKPNWYCLYLE